MLKRSGPSDGLKRACIWQRHPRQRANSAQPPCRLLDGVFGNGTRSKLGLIRGLSFYGGGVSSVGGKPARSENYFPRLMMYVRVFADIVVLCAVLSVGTEDVPPPPPPRLPRGGLLRQPPSSLRAVPVLEGGKSNAHQNGTSHCTSLLSSSSSYFSSSSGQSSWSAVSSWW